MSEEEFGPFRVDMEAEIQEKKLGLEKLKALPLCIDIDPQMKSAYSCTSKKRKKKRNHYPEKGLTEILKMVNDRRFPPVYEFETGVRVDGGWIVGSDAGEWGGCLAFVNENNESESLLYDCDCILGVYKTPAGLFAVTGHNIFVDKATTQNKGHLYRLNKIKGQWVPEKFADLCAEPEIIDQMKDGSVVICNYYGSFLINEKGLCRIWINNSAFETPLCEEHENTEDSK